MIPALLAENSGNSAVEILDELTALYQSKERTKAYWGIAGDGSIVDVQQTKICDVLSTKQSAIQIACDIATSILSGTFLNHFCIFKCLFHMQWIKLWNGILSNFFALTFYWLNGWLIVQQFGCVFLLWHLTELRNYLDQHLLYNLAAV